MPRMEKFFRWTARLVFLLIVLALLAGGGVIVVFNQWKTKKVAELDAGSELAQVDAGQVEFTAAGDGPAVLVCHGAPGGYDQAALIGEAFERAGYRVIAPSRPGFLRTPLTTGLTFAEQADALEELLDSLGIDQVVVVGFSSGSPVAVEFGKRHGGRTRGLVLISPVTRAYWPDIEKGSVIFSEAALFKTTGDIGAWMLVEATRRDPEGALESVLTIDSTLDAASRTRLAATVAANPDQREFFQRLVGTQAPLSPRESGTRNDLIMLRSLQMTPYETLQMPILVVQGSADRSAEWGLADDIVGKAPNAELFTVEGAGHLVWLAPDPNPLTEAIVNFLGGLPATGPAAVAEPQVE